MNRRDALQRVSAIMGGTIVGAEIFLYGCGPEKKQLSSVEFSPENISFLDEVGETILPTTESSPGAKAAQIGEFMKVIVTDCYEEKDQKVFLEGIVKLNEATKEKFEKDFMDLDDAQKKEFLIELDKEAKSYAENKMKEAPHHYFTMMKQLTLWGYFSSEIGATKALKYIETPGKWEGCTAYKEGDKAWAI